MGTRFGQLPTRGGQAGRVGCWMSGSSKGRSGGGHNGQSVGARPANCRGRHGTRFHLEGSDSQRIRMLKGAEESISRIADGPASRLGKQENVQVGGAFPAEGTT